MKKILVALAPLSVSAFVPSLSITPLRTKESLSVAGGSDWDTDDVSVDLDLPSPPPRRKQIVMSPAIPFLECPPVLVDCTMAGNVGFDPLGFAKTKEDLEVLREAEIRHSRLAMLVSVSNLCGLLAMTLAQATFHLTGFIPGCRRLATK